MNTNRYFSFSRLGLVMKRDLMENWKTNLWIFVGVFAAYLIAYLVSMSKFDEILYLERVPTFDQYSKSHWSVFAFIAISLLFYFAAHTMNNMKTRESRLAYLMLPATSLEKFVARALYVTIGVVVCVFVASLLADVAHFAFIPFFDNFPKELHVSVWASAWSGIFETISPFGKSMAYYASVEGEVFYRSQFWQFAWGYSAVLWFHSLFILGGNYFTKYPFVKTCGIMILSLIVLGYILSHLDISDFNGIENFVEQNEQWLTEKFVEAFMTLVTFCFTVLNWWLSYKLFTRQQVVKPKFRLL